MNLLCALHGIPTNKYVHTMLSAAGCTKLEPKSVNYKCWQEQKGVGLIL